ncbi:arabinogalactan oligomer / maltooligosaccharide transport system permease protein [Pseudobutyrivibrio sp. ACV-2]|uniref:carbohydrate ABC transporter permease n=1 Tax=Pseudobutyrivibrio sp. ACV-2 TaxID=1520801 RepID=UPI0008979675|nr:sugar ABC transporter permease [Pseudobutyrivibrio sp. ACV-2]SDZ77252.1 arabinogalactan oligomer / maltooligosaccharide transport system permease protein [Pseudobutyrivibrio sp. ACV-2]
MLKTFKKGDNITRLSLLIFGLGNIVRGQLGKGLIFLGVEILYIFYFIEYGIGALKGLFTLGTQEQGWVMDERKGIEILVDGDNSMLLLLFGTLCLMIIASLLIVAKLSLESAYLAQESIEKGLKPVSLKKDLSFFLDSKVHITLLCMPIIGILAFSVLPLLYMILVAFTNYNHDHQPPGKLFDWVGLDNFFVILNTHSPLGKSFWPILSWTIVWAIVATITCFLFGLILAMWINSPYVKIKKVWRSILATSVAVPQFVSLLIIRTMLQPEGSVNVLLKELGVIDNALPFWANATWARITIILVNLWIGAPYTMMIVTGILMNIPAELYEAAKIDGANTITIFKKITLPYIVFVMTPYLITQFIGNVNNFNVIFLLTAGGPSTIDYYQAGKTDLLVTWLYKLTVGSKDYCYASTIGILVFIISAAVSLLTYHRTSAYNNEEGFQ